MFQESIVNQDNIIEISLVGAGGGWWGEGATVSSVKAFHQKIAQPQHTQNKALGHAQCLYVLFPLFFPVIPTQETQKKSQI